MVRRLTGYEVRRLEIGIFFVIPANAGIQIPIDLSWIPAEVYPVPGHGTGMTKKDVFEQHQQDGRRSHLLKLSGIQKGHPHLFIQLNEQMNPTKVALKQP